ncbi:hypothetical protein BDW75DRAFT_214654 [Aspergillus navahoensis]
MLVLLIMHWNLDYIDLGVVPFHPSRSPESRRFLFIDSQEDVSPECGVRRQKKVLLSKVPSRTEE